MELMSFLLLYAMALSAGLAKSRFALVRQSHILNENRTFVQQKIPRNYEKKLHLCGKFVSKDKRHQMSHQDLTLLNRNNCADCIECMMSILHSEYHHVPHFYDMNNLHDMNEEGGTSINDINHLRSKRGDQSSEHQPTLSKKKKNKAKRSKEQRLVTLFEYKIAGDVYALKAKNFYRNNSNDDSSKADKCKIYKVVKSFPCDSAEGESLLTFAKKNSKRKAKLDSKAHHKTTTPSGALTKAPQDERPKTPSKRETDDGSGAAPDNYMPSIEDMYNL